MEGIWREVLTVEKWLVAKCGWPCVLRLEDTLLFIGGMVIGASIMAWSFAYLILRVRDNWIKYHDKLQDSDFAALRVVGESEHAPVEGRPSIYIDGGTVTDVLDSFTSYWLLLLFPKRYTVFKSRRRAKYLIWLLWGLSIIFAILSFILAMHVSVIG